MDTARSRQLLSAAACTAALASIYGVCIAVGRSHLLAEHPDALGTALTVNLTVSAALAVYLLGVRRGVLPRAVLIPVFGAGLVVARALVPARHHQVATVMMAAWSIVELALLAWLAYRARHALRAYRCQRDAGRSVPWALQHALASALGNGRAAGFIASELTILACATAGLFRRGPAQRCRDRDESMWMAALAGLGVALVGEAFAVHMLLRAWSPSAALIAGCLHAYTGLWLLGDARALRLSHGTRVDGDVLEIDLGLHARARLPLSAIDRLEAVGAAPPDRATPGYVRATLLGDPNLLIHLREPTPVHLALGRERLATTIGVALTAPEALAEVMPNNT